MLSNILNIYCKNIFNNFLIAESCRTRTHLFQKLPSPAPAPESQNAPVLHRFRPWRRFLDKSRWSLAGLIRWTWRYDSDKGSSGVLHFQKNFLDREGLHNCSNGFSAIPDCPNHCSKEVQDVAYLHDVFYQISETRKVQTRIIIPCDIMRLDL